MANTSTGQAQSLPTIDQASNMLARPLRDWLRNGHAQLSSGTTDPPSGLSMRNAVLQGVAEITPAGTISLFGMIPATGS